MLGSGHFGIVKRATSLNPHDRKEYAIKSIPKAKVGFNKSSLERELEHLMSVNHPNIIKLYEVYEDSNYIHIVMDMCTGGELFEYLVNNGRFSEDKAAMVMHCLLHAVCHLHSLGIAHRDLKPENIMLSTNDDHAEIKIIDLGLAKKFGDNEASHTILGSSYYVAPEVLESQYGLGCDIWSLGVILYMLLSGKPPFNGKNDEEVIKSIKGKTYSLEGPIWDNFSTECKDFIRTLLDVNPESRITAKQALENPWLELRRGKKLPKINRSVMKRLKHHINSNKIVKETMNILIHTLNQAEIKKMNLLFAELDLDKTGFITVSELQEGLKKSEVHLEGLELEKLFSDADHKDKIKYSEFLAMTLDRKHLENTDGMWLAFKYFDIDNTGYITNSNLKHSLRKAGWDVSKAEVHQMLTECGLEQIDKLYFAQFCKIFEGVSKKRSTSIKLSL